MLTKPYPHPSQAAHGTHAPPCSSGHAAQDEADLRIACGRKGRGQAVLSKFFPVKAKQCGQKKKSSSFDFWLLSNAGRPPARPGGRGGDTSLTAERGRQPRASGEE